ncbi:hypothetical protein DKP76_17515 [Falsochrobactrum shanghaiense]|uniref:DUF1269 domain-containing protein n=1 Tax=Falsochrobactrum shanghaiense TaxID=2201899 RepID=A0A316J5M2_9HYPH|nr:hypothetical protein [Falsochrobactrum shanghaiense]PWL16458.1 hypothetical protein DKP76_17515 [Falsochrobactrum shanghaiense]
MIYITGLFDNHDEAVDAVRALEEAGVSAENISLISNNADGRYAEDALHEEGSAATGAKTGAGVGAVAGGGAGLLTGLGLLSIPGVGPVVAGGWLTATLVGLIGGAAAGGVTGGLVGALVESGVPEAEAHAYSEAIRRGSTLVTVRCDETEREKVEAILEDWGRVNIAQRRDAYVEEGWENFNATGTPYTAAEIERERLRRR